MPGHSSVHSGNGWSGGSDLLGSKHGFFVNGVALFSTLVSAGSFMGFLGLAYRLGWSLTTMSFGVSSTLGFIFCMLLVKIFEKIQ